MYKKIKNILDVIFAFVGIIVMAPIFLAIIIAIRLDSQGKALFTQERVGKDGKIFLIYKFRTMKTIDVAFDTDHAVIEDGNPSVTRVGRILRKFKLDETPQILNILKGEMSFVGPRPLMPIYLEEYAEWEKQKFAVKPGLTGYSQVNGNGYLSKKGRSYYDVKYAKEISFLLDVKLFFSVIKVILKGEKACLKEIDEEEIERVEKEFIDNKEKNEEN